LTVTGSVEFDGAVGGAGGLTKAGAGTLTLSSSNDYSGPTTVNAGTLRLANPGGSATGSGNVIINNGGTVALSGDGNSSAALITINAGGILNVTGRTNAVGLLSGQTLRGTGTATSGATASRMILGLQSVTVANGAAIQAGDGSATGVLVVQSAGGSLAFDSGSELKLRITGGAPSNTLGGSGNGPATNSLLVMSGSGTLTFANGMVFDFNGTGLAASPPGSAFSYQIGTGPTHATDLTLTAANVTFSTTGFAAFNQSILYQADGDIYFNFMAVPEPASVLAVCCGAAVAIRVLRRRTIASLAPLIAS
jgi:autotransporter-associated beta strand protein